MQNVIVIGGGLSGSEAALQLARRSIPVELWEMRPEQMTPAHRSGDLAELVCSNSFKSVDETRAQGLLKLELDSLGCEVLRIARENAIPGGSALVVDREQFAIAVTAAAESNPLITLKRGEFADLAEAVQSEKLIVLATGPLTSGALWEQIVELVGSEGSYFFDATAPVITAASLDHDIVFPQSRYDKGGADDYYNCPLDQDQYTVFREALLSAEQYPLSPGDDYKLFEGCLPIEELALRGVDTMRYGPLKPRGLSDPRTGQEPHACIQLRREDALRQSFSLVGFQTRLRTGEQDRVFKIIPGLAGAQFTRHGRMHRNSYLDAPQVMRETLQLRDHPRVVIAGQLTGLEGYMAALATGYWAGVSAARLAGELEATAPPERSCLGAMLKFMCHPGHREYKPAAFQFGMLTWLPEKIRKRDKQALIRAEAEAAWTQMK